MEPKLLKASQTAEALGVSVRTVRRLADSGALKPIRFSPQGWLRFRPEEVEQFLERAERTAA